MDTRVSMILQVRHKVDIWYEK